MKYLFVLGNGFSLDLLNHLKKSNEIPLTNLFAYGDRLPWPGAGDKAFISFRNTPNLWILGVRPSNSSEKNNQIIENIITCANAFYLKPPSKRAFGQTDKRSIYIRAYKELVVYLKYLFVHFDKEILVTKENVQDWAWSKEFIRLQADESVSNVEIITFNYDVWLERVLSILEVPYKVTSFAELAACKFSITKPHGSISFVHKTVLDPLAFNINYDSELVDGSSDDFELAMIDLDRNAPVIPIIPPAGDSSRFKTNWAGVQRNDAIKKSGSFGEGDNVVVCGLSYWHVDRKEIDDVLLNISDQVELAFINPAPPEAFDAVLTSLFEKYEHYTSVSRYIGGKSA